MTAADWLDTDKRWALARQPLADDSFETKDRVAGLMVLLYGQGPARICRLTTAHVLHDEKGVALRLNKTPLRLPPPLDELVLKLVEIANDHARLVNSNELNAPWLFPTQRPGKPLNSKSLAIRLRQIGLPPESGRCAALFDLCTQIPRRSSNVFSASARRPPNDGPHGVRAGYAAEVAGRSVPAASIM
ncbi:hypothetical protein [Streptomyces sp. NPDC002221]|uniref:hypothetical protein n=1 Tax=Streptomyces sp. NPDC002221 TaxID=3364639 RepID=UPI003680928D